MFRECQIFRQTKYFQVQNRLPTMVLFCRKSCKTFIILLLFEFTRKLHVPGSTTFAMFRDKFIPYYEINLLQQNFLNVLLLLAHPLLEVINFKLQFFFSRYRKLYSEYLAIINFRQKLSAKRRKYRKVEKFACKALKCGVLHN